MPEPYPNGSDRQRYLDAVGRRLRMPDDERVGVLQELSDHIDDALRESVDAGRSPEEAECDALRRLGPPETLGDSLRRAHQTTRRLLAAAGGGIWHGLSGAVSGYFATLLFPLLPTVLMVATITTVASAIGHLTISFGTRLEISAALGAVSLSGAAWYAGRRSANAFAKASLYAPREADRAVASVGFLLLSALVVIVPGDRTWLSVVLSGAIPVAFLVGAITADGNARSWLDARWPSWLPTIPVTALVVLVAITGLGIAAGSLTTSVAPDAQDGSAPMTAERWAALGYTSVAPTFARTEYETAVGFSPEGWERVSIKDLDVDWTHWGNVRIEAWRATEPASFDGPQALVDPRRGPYLRIPIDDPTRAQDTWVHVGQPGVSAYLLFVVADDGRSDASTAIGRPSGDRTLFHGTMVEWFAAVFGSDPVHSTTEDPWPNQ